MDKINDFDTIESFYNIEADNYIKDRYAGDTWEHHVFNDRREIVLDMMKDSVGKVLDVGCGPGILTKELLNQGLEVYSMDLAINMLLQIKQETKKLITRPFLINGEMDNLSFDNEYFDNVSAIGVLGLAENIPGTLKEMDRVLKKGGTLIVQIPNASCPTKKLYKQKSKLLNLVNLNNQIAFVTRLIKNSIDPKAYSYKHFARILERLGYIIVRTSYYDFRIPLFERLHPKLSIRTMKRLHCLLSESKKFGWLGEGYVVKAKKLVT